VTGNTRWIAGAAREVVWSYERDAGDMFTSEVGVWLEDAGFVAYVKDGWGGGNKSKPRPDQATARADTARLWERFYG